VNFDELEQHVARATMEFYNGRAPALPSERNAAESVARIASVPIGHVRDLFKSWGFGGTLGGGVAATPSSLERVAALVEMPIARSQSPGARQQFFVTAGDRSQVQVGHHVSGTQSIATYQQVLEALKEQIERSPMPREEKETALQTLGTFMAIPGVVELITLGINMIAR
jgi:hypothetical protein